jgi:hypothetical protein
MSGDRDAEHVYAALSVYLLAGLFFGVLHWGIESHWLGSLSEAGGSADGFSLSTAILLQLRDPRHAGIR